MTAGWEDDAGLAAGLADGVVVIAPGGTIVWANEAFARLMGRSVADLVGADGLALIHPDELARAADGIAYASQFPGRTSVAPYRVRHGDGSWLDIELKSGVIHREGGEHLILLIRDGSNNRSLNRALQSVANGEALEHTATLLVEAVTHRWPETGAAIALDDADGNRSVIASRLPEALQGHAAGEPDLRAGVAPLGPDRVGDVVVLDASDLAAEVRLAAEAAGFEGCAIARVEDPGGRPAYVIVWFDHTVIAHLEFAHAAGELLELLGLALQRRHHLAQLWTVARHDSLTGLLNRAGFLERFGAQVTAARRSGDETVGLLYVDLDGLKAVNDRGGHAAGDRLLVDVATRLRSSVGEPSLVARLGGDEFVVAVRHPIAEASERCEALAADVVAALAIDVTAELGVASGGVGDRPGGPSARVRVAASVGLALDDASVPPSRTLERADAAMYRAKAAGRASGTSTWSR